MHWIPLGIAVVLAAGAAPAAAVPPAVVHVVVQAPEAPGPDSMFQAAQNAFTRGEYRAGVDQLARLVKRYPKSRVAMQALFFQAFALRRLGSNTDLRQALQALQTLEKRFPKLAKEYESDIRSLEVSIQGDLAQRGDAQAAQEIARRAELAAQADPRDSRCPEENQIRIEALNHLQKMDPAAAGKLIQEVLADRSDGVLCTRRLVVFVLAQRLDLPDAENQLLDVARNDPDVQVRGQAVVWLSAVKSDRAVQTLDSILSQTDDNDIREKALFALGEQDRPMARQALRDYIDRTDVPEEARGRAIRALGRFPTDENSEYLRARYNQFDEVLKGQALWALAQSHQPRENQWLLQVARNTSEPLPLRAQALFHASQGGAPIKVLVRLYEQLPEQQLRAQLIFAYAQRSEAAAFDKLLAITSQEENQELKDAAAFWLKKSKDPRAAEAVQALRQQGR